MAQTQLTLIPSHLLSYVSGGHSAATGLSIIFLLEVPHMIMGFIEFANYISGHWANGCSNVAEDDYFGALVCGLFTSGCSGDGYA